MHNPVVPTLALSDEHSLPLIILIFTNSQYAVMKHFHKRFYPDGVAVADDVYYCVKICGPRYEESAAMIGGIGQRVEDPGELRDADHSGLRKRLGRQDRGLEHHHARRWRCEVDRIRPALLQQYR